MATAEQESGAGRTPGFPNLPDAMWWQLRKLFKIKGAPRVFNEDYVVNQGLRKQGDSAKSLVRVLKRLHFFQEDGRPEDPRLWDWLDDSKYPEVCKQILHEMYPPEVIETFTDTDPDTQDRLQNWFVRKLHVTPPSATQYARFYMLLLEADPSKQEEGAAQKPTKAPKATATSTGGSRFRTKNGAKSQAAGAPAQEARTGSAEGGQQEHADGHHRTAPARPHRGIEPSLNINVQIHIPAEASADQIDQIFKSMAKHLYQRQDEAGE